MAWSWTGYDYDPVFRYKDAEPTFFQTGRNNAEARFWQTKIHEGDRRGTKSQIEIGSDGDSVKDHADVTKESSEDSASQSLPWQLSPRNLSCSGVIGSVVKNTFIEHPDESSVQREGARRRARSVPKDMGSTKDTWNATCHAFAFAATPSSGPRGSLQCRQQLSVHSDDDKQTWADLTFTTLDTSAEDDDDRLDDDEFGLDDSAASEGSTWRYWEEGSEVLDGCCMAADDDVRTAAVAQQSSHQWCGSSGQEHRTAMGSGKTSPWNHTQQVGTRLAPHAKHQSWGGNRNWWPKGRGWESHRHSNSGGSVRRSGSDKNGKDAWNWPKSWWTSERWHK